MPRAWSTQDERQYKAIHRQQKATGKSEDKAKEIAARTVNKRRRMEGRTLNKTSQGTGNPNTPLASRSLVELRNIASQRGVRGRSTMIKRELISAIAGRRK